MAKGKNKQVSKKGKVAKKGEKHPFTKKEWFQVMAPAALKESKQIGWTCCKKPVGTQIVSDFLKARVAEMSLSDMTRNGKDVTKKIKILIDDVSGNSCSTSFYEYELCREKIAAMLKKRQTLIEVITEVKTQDGVILRVIVMAVTSKRPGQQKINSYAQTSKVRLFRKKVGAELIKIAAEKSANDFAHEIITDVTNPKLEKVGSSVIPGIRLQIVKLKISKKNVAEIKGNVEASASTLLQGDKKVDENPNAKTTL
jgi:small subunit ribosomal protein S3Ae